MVHRYAHRATTNGALEFSGEVFGGPVGGVGISRVISSEGVQQERVVLHGAGKGTDVVEGPREREDAALAHPPEARLHAHRTAEGGGDPDGGGGVGTQRRVAQPRRDSRARAATRPAGDPGRVVGVARRPEVGAVAGWAVGELVGVRLADNDRSGIFKLPDARRAVVRDVILVKGRAHRGTYAPRVDEIFKPDRNAMKRAAVLPGLYLLLHSCSSFKCHLGQYG